MMDELDSFKLTWKTITDSRIGKGYSLDEIRKMVKGRSNNELMKIRRKIITELSAALLLSLFLVVFIYFYNPSDTRYALLLVVFILSISFVPYIKVIRLNVTNHPDLKTYLSEFINRFERLIKQYIQMAALLMPVAGLGGFLLGIHSSVADSNGSVFFKLQNLLLALLIVITVSILGYWLQKRYFTWVYGKNIQRLRDCLNELEEAEQNAEQ